jgi:hypothetical protein
MDRTTPTATIAMSTPTFHISISGSVVAAYAAVVSTITGLIQFSNFLRDRALVRVTVRHKMEIVGDPRYKNQTLTIVTVTNAGRRPVTITTIGARCLYPHNHIILPNCTPQLPYELTEGKSLMAIMTPSNFDFATVDLWEAYDAVGRSHQLKVASWRARTLSNLKWRLEWRREAAKKRKLPPQSTRE